MVTSPYEWDDKPQTNKQTLHVTEILFSIKPKMFVSFYTDFIRLLHKQLTSFETHGFNIPDRVWTRHLVEFGQYSWIFRHLFWKCLVYTGLHILGGLLGEFARLVRASTGFTYVGTAWGNRLQGCSRAKISQFWNKLMYHCKILL